VPNFINFPSKRLGIIGGRACQSREAARIATRRTTALPLPAPAYHMWAQSRHSTIRRKAGLRH
jgi:hypothetical protein